MMSKFFIERPVLSNVLAIVIVLIGAVAMFNLPIAQYPNVVPPTVQVVVRYPGASAQTVLDTVALPIELQVNGVEGMIYMQSTSASDGTYTLTVTFDIGTDLDFAQVLVQNRVSAALASLPLGVQAQGVTVRKRSTAILQILDLTSPDGRFDSLFMSNYASINLVNELSRVPGVGNVVVFGVGQYAMRVWIDPQRLYSFGLTPQDVVDAISQQSQQVSSGQTGMPPVPAGQDFQYTVNVEGRLSDPAEFGNIVVKAASGQGGRLIRVRDVARVELGSQTYSQAFLADGKPAAGIAISQTPEANSLDVAGRVNAKMAELAHAFPEGLTYGTALDTTTFVRASIREVWMTLIEAGVLVLLVILIFVQNLRAMLVPATTVPVTIIGSFAAMAALGFTINISTLFGVVLAIGIVVDDAIVIVEGVDRHIQEGLSAHDAAIKAMDELFGPIVGITLVLMSVFLPASFMPGLTGRMFAQFALVIAATALISAINAVTLKPTQCALWLKTPVPPEKRNVVYRFFNRCYDPLERGYCRLIRWMVGHSGIMVLIALALAGLGLWGIVRLPTAFIPNEDQGYVIVGLQLPDGASLQRTEASLQHVTDIAMNTPGVSNVVSVAGISLLDGNATLANAGVDFVRLKDWTARGHARGQDLQSVVNHIQGAIGNLADGSGFVVVPPPIQGVGNVGGFTMVVEQRDGSFDYNKLLSATQGVVDAANSQSALQRVLTTFRANVPQIRLTIDRTKAESLRVLVGDVFSALSTYLGSTYVNQFNKFGLTLQVYVQADSPFRLHPEDILRYNVRSQDGKMVPIGALATIEPETGPALITLYNLYPAATVVGSPAPGYSTGQAIDLMEQVAQQTLPPGTNTDWTAMSFQERVVGNRIYLGLGLGLLLVYLCLAGQYESWVLPLAVILAVPLALIGPSLLLGALGLDNNLYTQIGLMLLIALSAKNGILIVEMARHHRMNEGQSIEESAVEAGRTRFRPIMMTSIAFILSVVPLAMASGAGAAARVSLGMSVLSGMIASTCLAVLFVPSFFVVLERFDEWRKQRKARVSAPGHAMTPSE